MSINVGRFVSSHRKAAAVLDYLESAVAKNRMELAIELGRPPVLGVITPIMHYWPDFLDELRERQCLGYWVNQVVESMGYRRKGYVLTKNPKLTKATKFYEKQ
jgi:hypothetical protein